MRCSRRATLILLVSLMGLLPGMLFAQPDVTTVKSESASRDQFFGILGQVAKPGVYELPADRRTLNDLIEAAGGLTANASNNLRIVRRGRSGGQTFFQPRVRFELRPGDVLISDRRRAGIAVGGGVGSDAARRDARDSTVFVTTPDRNGQGGTTITGRASDSGTPDVVQLGVVGLIDRPVVIAIPAGQATLQTVLTTLHQPREGAWQITLLRDGSTSHTVPLTEAAKTVLTTGTVLVFDQKSAQPETLPKLPPPVRWQDRTLESAPPQSLTAAAESAKPATTDESPTPLAESRSTEPRPLTRGTTDRLIPPSRSLVSAPGSRTVVVDDTDQFEVAGESEADAAIPRGPSGKPGIEESVSDSVSTSPVLAGEPGLSGQWLAAIILLGTLVCIGCLLLVEFFRGPAHSPAAAVSVLANPAEPQSNQVSREPVAATVRPVESVASPNLLDDLVANRLPVVTEQFALPHGVRIYGKPVERTDELQFRLDAAQPVPAPHIRRSVTAMPASSMSEHMVGVEDIPRRATSERVPSAPLTGESLLLDRVLSHLERGGRAGAGAGAGAVAGAVRSATSRRSEIGMATPGKSRSRGGAS